MKRIKTFFAVALICAMGTVGYTTYADANMTAQERLLLANVEALTTGEGEITGCRSGGLFCILFHNSYIIFQSKTHYPV